MNADERIKLAVCWGHFDCLGNWWPNPHLSISVADQRRENVENGHMTSEGQRIPLPRKVDWWQN